MKEFNLKNTNHFPDRLQARLCTTTLANSNGEDYVRDKIWVGEQRTKELALIVDAGLAE